MILRIILILRVEYNPAARVGALIKAPLGEGEVP
jgi:hypothetical protein